MIPDAVEAELAAILADLPPGLTHRQAAAAVRRELAAHGWTVEPTPAAGESAPQAPMRTHGRPADDRPSDGHAAPFPGPPRAEPPGA